MTDVSRLYNASSSIPDYAEYFDRALSPFESIGLRVPFYLTSSLRKSQQQKGVSLAVNPSNVSFRSTKRITKKDTQGGSVFVHWTNRLGRNNDILQIEFTGQTGNINLRRGGYKKGNPINEMAGRVYKSVDWLKEKQAEAEAGGLAVGVEQAGSAKKMAGAYKLANFHNLHSLTREPVRDPLSGAPVYYYIVYSSPLFGNTMVTFIGHFDRPLEFTDSADPSPFNAQYSFGFTAQNSYPSFDLLYPVIMANLGREFMNDLEDD